MINGSRKLVPWIFIVTLLAGEEAPPDLIRGLGADDFKEREVSQNELLAWAKESKNSSFKGFVILAHESDDPEVRQRCFAVLKILSDEDYLSSGNGFLGIEMEDVMTEVPKDDAPRAGILIKTIVGNSPASRSGLLIGDQIVALDGKIWREPGARNQFRNSISGKKPLDEVVLTIKRGNGKIEDVKVILGRNPIQDVPNAIGDLKLLDEMARQRHFKNWLKEQQR